LIKRIKESYSLDVDLEKLEGEEFNNYLKEHKDLKRISLKQLEKVSNNKSLINEYIKNFEGLQPGTNYNRKIVREYLTKAKKRYVVGMREVEKYIRLE